MSKKNGGWTGSALLPFVLLSEKLDSNFLVVGISPFNNLSGGEELTEEQQVMLILTGWRMLVSVEEDCLCSDFLCAPSRRVYSFLHFCKCCYCSIPPSHDSLFAPFVFPRLRDDAQAKLYPLTNFRQFFKLAGQLLGAKIRNICTYRSGPLMMFPFIQQPTFPM
jgi:hypothetical protein